MEKILSIIVPTYNMEKYLDKCLSSLIVSDEDLMRHLEVLVVNDGSKDRSSEIAHSYVDRYPETYIVIDKKNGNYGSCINAALPLASGKYVKVLDADDSYDSMVLCQYLNYLACCETDLVLNNIRMVDSDGLVQPTADGTNTKALLDESRIYTIEEWMKLRTYVPFIHTIAYKRSIFEDLSYHQTEGISYTDSEWVAWPMTQVQTVSSFNGVLYNYLLGRPDQTMNEDVLLKSVGQRIEVILNLGDFFEAYQGEDIHKRYLRNCFVQESAVLYLNKLYEGSRKHIIQTFEGRLKTRNPHLYARFSDYPLLWSDVQYVRFYHHPWRYIIATAKNDGVSKALNYFDIATYHNLLHPQIAVVGISWIRNRLHK